eukprot:2174647-Amphidinium_carterae.1
MGPLTKPWVRSDLLAVTSMHKRTCLYLEREHQIHVVEAWIPLTAEEVLSEKEAGLKRLTRIRRIVSTQEHHEATAHHPRKYLVASTWPAQWRKAVALNATDVIVWDLICYDFHRKA